MATSTKEASGDKRMKELVTPRQESSPPTMTDTTLTTSTVPTSSDDMTHDETTRGHSPAHLISETSSVSFPLTTLESSEVSNENILVGNEPTPTLRSSKEDHHVALLSTATSSPALLPPPTPAVIKAIASKEQAVGKEEAVVASDSKSDHVVIEDGTTEKGSAPTTTSTTGTSTSSCRPLDETTLKRMKEHVLKSKNTGERLDVDELEKEMIDTNRTISEQARKQCLAIDLCADSEDEDEQLRSSFHKEEYYALAERYFKRTVSGAGAGEAHLMDKPTLSWLRRAMGIHRERQTTVFDGLEVLPQHHFATATSHATEPAGEPSQQVSKRVQQEQENDSQEPRRPAEKKQRLTRSRARSTRVKKREERVARENQGLDALRGAVKELDEEEMESKQNPRNKRKITAVVGEKKKAEEKKPSTISTVRKRGPATDSTLENTSSSTACDGSLVRSKPRHCRVKKRPRHRSHIFSIYSSVKTSLKTSNGNIVRIKVGGSVINEDGTEVLKLSNTAVRGPRRQLRSIPLTDRQFSLWFEHSKSTKT